MAKAFRVIDEGAMKPVRSGVDAAGRSRPERLSLPK